jgi:tetratricopeptide (TPR) repeat protein
MLVPVGLVAQSPATGAEDLTVDAVLREADAAHGAFRPLDALVRLDSLLARHPDSYAALWRAAREAVNLEMLAEEEEERKAWAETAVSHARSARAVDPDGAEGASWLAIALGRQALGEGPQGRVRLAVEIREVALDALRVDSLSAAAHHVLGEWNAEIRRISGLERWLARNLLGGGVFSEASWEAALRHLERAVELNPAGLIHHLGLARAYLDVGRDDDARKVLRDLLDRPSIEPVDPLHKQSAVSLLLDGERSDDRS